jgi:hypothetical protein
MNLGVSFWFRATLPIQSHKPKPEALCQLTLRLVNQKISKLNSHAHLTDLLDYEYEVFGQFMNLCVSFWFMAILPIQLHKVKPEALCQLTLRLVNQKISELNSYAHLTDLLDYESEVLGQFMNLCVSFWFRTTLPIQSHKVKPKALCHLALRLVNQKISEHNSHAHLTDILDYESKASGQFMNLGMSFWFRAILPI